MLNFLVRRSLATVPVLAVVAVIVFLLLRLTPGDPAAAIAGDAASAQDIARIRVQLGLDEALPVQFAHWIGQVLSADLGYSYFYKMPVTALIAQRLEPTLSVAALTIALTVLAAVPLGTLAAYRRGRWIDRMVMGGSVLGFSLPVFVAGYLMIWLFSLHLGWFPAQGYMRLADGAGPWLHSLALPCVTLSVMSCALVARVTRAAVAEALTEDFVQTARAKGIQEWRMLTRHALANAAVPIATVIGLSVAGLIGGVVVTETIFAIPGVGQLTVDAVLSRDYPLIQGITLFFSVSYVVINLLVDMSYLLLDPRIRY
ncbi:ABC transporter permease [Cupriavidus oxalaticus]|uniref:ABC transporter permease n=1 Tax=Cupriavidus oxalaticus TaxID=96344 RepID=A0A375G172_9BURK|nr:ABC transporter permease [Cupriavidus oxalaticus]QRQ88837.1 ABC transporter permease [Cupriavidus oxalaticus]QRQ92837.1 ABC transporter permease [Cupriavidus oxalaticus]WQD81443.1 ABC transporter permease [Cupriavidus oxalaticus]SPC07385.1 putative peptide transporter permease subunit: membrane component of ABC superfamily [Cupriavidus oxalaticus]SPC12755.1 putative peptide transporter permease subunit: membrane component of ABC superfamily [Cupriavidus oxalaticus]